MSEDEARRKARRVARKAAGLCTECETPPRAGMTLCEKHYAYRLKAQRQFIARHVAAGLCRRCKEPPAKGGTLCARHAQENRERVGAIAVAARAAGLCADYCNRPATCGLLCEPCWWKNLSYAHFGNRRSADALKAMAVAQGYKCALTGRALRPGVNIAVDHIVPKSRGGSLGIENCRLVDDDANQAKQALLDSELVALCREIVATADAAAHALTLRQLAAN